MWNKKTVSQEEENFSMDPHFLVEAILERPEMRLT